MIIFQSINPISFSDYALFSFFRGIIAPRGWGFICFCVLCYLGLNELSQKSMQNAAVENARNQNQLDPANDVGDGSHRQYPNPRADQAEASEKVKEYDDPFLRAFYSPVCIGRMREILQGR